MYYVEQGKRGKAETEWHAAKRVDYADRGKKKDGIQNQNKYNNRNVNKEYNQRSHRAFNTLHDPAANLSLSPKPSAPPPFSQPEIHLCHCLSLLLFRCCSFSLSCTSWILSRLRILCG